MPTSKELYTQYKEKMQRIADVRNASAVLQWDQETYLPPNGGAYRGQQISTLSEITHRLFSEEELGGLLQELLSADGLSPEEKRNVQLTEEDFTKNKKYSAPFVRKLAEQTNRTFHAWIEARKQNSFAVYGKELSALVQLKKEESHLLQFKDHPYDALLNEFEKGATVALLDKTFTHLLPSLKEIMDHIAAKPQVDASFLQRHYPKQQQWDWGLHLLKSLNFDFNSGRQDVSEHPFSTSFNARDVRITTRINEADFGNMTWSCIHEAGHALYEQGLPPDQYGLPSSEACSYSIHESQSRLWENNVGRSRGFWTSYYPQLQAMFPEQLGDISLNDFYKGINQVHPSLIRTEADEISYHFHVYIRYELEKRLIEGSVDAAGIPQFWNEAYKKYLDVTVPDDKRGCLQDVHWGHGSFGYFPTYSLGSFYAAQFYACATDNVPGLEEGIAGGNTMLLLNWLRTTIHAKGRLFTSEELCNSVTGKPLDVGYFTRYLLEKYTTIYNL